MSLSSVLPWIQIILAAVLIGAILLQQSEAGLGGTFGGTMTGNPFRTKRGFEKTLFVSTIILAILFVLSVFFGSYFHL